MFGLIETVKASVAKTGTEIEPSLIAVGPKHFSVAMNNRVWIYEITAGKFLRYINNSFPILLLLHSNSNDCFLHRKKKVFLEPILVTELQYLFSINAMVINENFVATKFDGTVQLHKVSLLIFRKDSSSFFKTQN